MEYLILIKQQSMENYVNLKDSGNNYFKQKKFLESIHSFQTAIDLIIKEQSRQSINGVTQVGKLYVILNINAAFAALNIKKKEWYKQAIKFCDVALEIDPKNQKGLFRRALANKEYAQLLEIESKGTSDQLITLYGSAKKDLEDVVTLDRGNDLAQKKLTEVIKNIYRVTVSQGKEVNLSSSKPEKIEQSRQHQVQQKVKVQQVQKKNLDMNKILKEYKVQEVTILARQKVEHQYLTQQLPKSRAELEKALREIEKSQEVVLQFIYRMTDDYLKKVQPTFDMLFQMIGVVIKIGEGQAAKNALQVMKNQKSFNLFWKSYSSGEKKAFAQKWVNLGLKQQDLK